MKTINKTLLEKISHLKNKLAGISAEPHKVAMGYAFGIFLAATPLIGIKVFIAIAVTFLFKWNKVAAIIGVFHINPLTGPLFYGFSFLVGSSVLGSDVAFEFTWPITIKSLYDILTTNSLVFLSLLTGGFILGLPLAIAAYFFSNSVIHHKTSLKTMPYENQ
jgi:uncharacterized protein (DUF2062 family)